MFSKTLIPFVIFLLPFLLSAQTSHHGLSLRVGAKAISAFDLSQPNPEVLSIVTTDNLGFTGSLRYNYFFGERLSLYAGVGRTYTSAWLLFERPSTNGLPFSSRSGPQVSQRITQVEWGASYAYPLSYRLSLVADVGAQWVSVARGGGRGSQRVTDRDDNVLIRSQYSYEENPDGQSGYALQVSPGVRLRLSDYFYLTLRGDFVFSSVLLMEQGQVEASSTEFPEPSFGTFERRYAGQGLDLMFTYRF